MNSSAHFAGTDGVAPQGKASTLPRGAALVAEIEAERAAATNALTDDEFRVLFGEE